MGTGWKKSKFTGVRYREHPTRKHGIGRDRYFTVRYQKEGKRNEEGLGWASEGWTAEKAALKLAELKRAAQIGEGPQRLREKRELEAQRRAAARAKKEQEKREGLTFDSFFTGTYLPYAKSNKKYSSWKTEEGFYKNWIKPILGHKPMVTISPLDLERIKKKLKDAGRSPRTVKYCIATVRVIINLARKLGAYEGANPASSSETPARRQPENPISHL